MPRLHPIQRVELITRLELFGYNGPHSGGKHQFMIRGNVRLVLPNPHKKDISVDLLKRIIRQAGISREEWQSIQG